MPLDGRSRIPSRLRRTARALRAGVPEDGTVALVVRAGIALLVVTAALAQYVLGLLVASARSAWSRRAAIPG
jgi:hypothetical protein